MSLYWQRLLRAANAPLTTRLEPLHTGVGVVLGAPTGPDSLSATVRERVDVAVDLFHHNTLELLVFSGRGYKGPVEAEAMADHALRRGVPEEQILVESDSLTTEENAKYCAKLLLPEHRRVAVISQPFHLRRACFWFRYHGFDPVGVASEDSIHYRKLSLGLKWTVREYAAWAVTGFRLFRGSVYRAPASFWQVDD